MYPPPVPKKPRLSGYERLFLKTEKLECACMHVQFIVNMLKVFLSVLVNGSSATTVGSAIRQTARDFVHGKATTLFKQVLAERNVVNEGEYDHKDFCQSMGGSCIHVKDFWSALKDIIPETYSSIKDQSVVIEASSNCAILCYEDREWRSMAEKLSFSTNEAVTIVEPSTSYDADCLDALNETFEKAIESDRLLRLYDDLKNDENRDFLLKAVSETLACPPDVSDINLGPVESLIEDESQLLPLSFDSPLSPGFCFPKRKHQGKKPISFDMPSGGAADYNLFSLLAADDEADNEEEEEVDLPCQDVAEEPTVPADNLITEAGNTYIIFLVFNVFVNIFFFDFKIFHLNCIKIYLRFPTHSIWYIVIKYRIWIINYVSRRWWIYNKPLAIHFSTYYVSG